MYYWGESGGFSFWRYHPGWDQNIWTLTLGFGGRAVPPPREGYFDPLYRFQIKIEWWPLVTCFEWWCDVLGTERGRGVVCQYRIHSFRRWPIAVQWRIASGEANAPPLALQGVRSADRN